MAAYVNGHNTTVPFCNHRQRFTRPAILKVNERRRRTTGRRPHIVQVSIAAQQRSETLLALLHQICASGSPEAQPDRLEVQAAKALEPLPDGEIALLDSALLVVERFREVRDSSVLGATANTSEIDDSSPAEELTSSEVRAGSDLTMLAQRTASTGP